MKIEFRPDPLAQFSTLALVAYCFEDAPASSGTVERLPAETLDLLQQLQTAGELTGKMFECTIVRWPRGWPHPSCWWWEPARAKNSARCTLRHLVGTAVRNLRSRGVREVTWILGSSEPGAVASVVDGALVADYDADRYRIGAQRREGN